MSELETNIYRITNLRDLASTYRTYRVVNLHRDQEEYYQNCQQLTRMLSFKLRSPAAVIDRNDEAILVVKQDAPEPPKETPPRPIGYISAAPWPAAASLLSSPPCLPRTPPSRS